MEDKRLVLLFISALIWIALHLGLAGTRLRNLIVARIGDGAFRGVFSLTSLAALALIIHAWRDAPVQPLWDLSDGMRIAAAAVMLAASILFVASVTGPSPTAVGGDAALEREPSPILRVTRHPMLWSFGLWALVHMACNGDVASLLFFGSFAITAFAGMPSIDAKIAARTPGPWSSFAAKTSIIPFAATVAGRNRMGWDPRLGIALLGGVALWAALAWLHPWLFGVVALPA